MTVRVNFHVGEDVNAPGKHSPLETTRQVSFSVHDQSSFGTISPVPKYSFPKLDHETDQIRLFKLEHGGPLDELVGSFDTFLIPDAPPFRALSYERWNDTEEYKVYIDSGFNDSGFINVRVNLYMFLTGHRANMNTNGSSEYLWIDQLCINQEDDSEKGHQVGRMSAIFSKADEVIAWLGPDYERFAYLCRQKPSIYKEHRSVSTFGERSFRSSFWSRLWILQEIFLAKRVTVMIGCQAISALTLRNDLDWDQDLINTELALRALISDDEKPAFTLLDAIRCFSHMACRDPKGKVFGLLGMVYQHHRPSVHRHMSISQVFYHTVEKVFALEGFTTSNFREFFVLETLISLGVRMGMSANEALDTCQMVYVACHGGRFLTRLTHYSAELYIPGTQIFASWLYPRDVSDFD